MWIRAQGKARIGEKAEHTCQYVSILRRSATQPWALRRFFEMGYRKSCRLGSNILLTDL